ncbi:MAG: response regulator transcription factor [Anaerolineae bacterium]|nr:response regulator transcription factor [Anaerolineae bacterium]
MAGIVLAGADQARAHVLGSWLVQCPHEVEFRSLEELGRHLAGAEPDVVILDLLDGGVDASRLCDRIRQGSDVPLLVLLRRSSEQGHGSGPSPAADQQLVWPFGPALLRAHVEALVRRVKGGHPWRTRYADGVVTVDLPARRVAVNGRISALTATETRLLGALMQRAGEIVLSDELLRATWGTADRKLAGRLHLYVHYLRHKVEPDPTHPRYILTRKKWGYVFQAGPTGGFSKDSLMHWGS